MNTKHTKGDWMVSGGDQIVAMPSQCKITNRVSGWNQQEAEANAQLIAAAPDLLESEIENLELLKYISGKAREFNMWSNKVQLLYQRIAETEAIIKKATE